jgi:hypothetical protein
MISTIIATKTPLAMAATTMIGRRDGVDVDIGDETVSDIRLSYGGGSPSGNNELPSRTWIES